MNDEEKKAIETLKNIVIQEYDWWINKGDYAESNVKEVNDAIKTILNLIEKQQKEIEKLRSETNNWKDKINKLKEEVEAELISNPYDFSYLLNELLEDK